MPRAAAFSSPSSNGRERDNSYRAVDAMKRAIQAYQVRRMRATHDGLFRSPEYRPLCEFFLEDLYGPRDFSRRTAFDDACIVDQHINPAKF